MHYLYLNVKSYLLDINVLWFDRSEFQKEYNFKYKVNHCMIDTFICTGILKLLQSDPDGPYPMTNVPCGYAVIINNYEFDEATRLEFRYGSDVDVRKMKELFQWLQFEVDVYENRTADQIKSIVRKYCYGKEHTKFDCFVLFLMSHGYADGVFGTDGNLVNVRRDIRKFLTAGECFSLANKPKLIFVQACRGGGADKGFVVIESGHPLVKNAPSQQVSNYPTTYTPSNLDITPGFSPDVDVEYIPEDSDILISYASTAYHAALRNTYTGGWFVTKLYDVIFEFAKTEDLQSMITRVTREVASQKKVTKNKEVYMQCPEQIGNLRKKVFFNLKKS